LGKKRQGFMNLAYWEKGFSHRESLFTSAELEEVYTVLNSFHQKCIKENNALFLDQAINSSGITGRRYLDQASRLSLFRFISHQKIMALIMDIIPTKPCFMNTQLFFNPNNAEQKNYWHRDPQYHLSLEEQKEALQGPEVLHIRIAFKDETGLELIPGTHKRWDSAAELDVRLEKMNGIVFHDLPGTNIMPLQAGDVLLFSGNMIHRGLYGMDRFALDILVCCAAEHLVSFAEEHCLPSKDEQVKINRPALFNNTIALKNQSDLRHRMLVHQYF
jgi:hypothetical protein